MDDREYRLARLNALATLMDLAGMSVAEATRIREQLNDEQLQALRVAGTCAIRTLARAQVLHVLAQANL